MALNIGREIAALGRMTAKELRTKYLDVFGEQTRSYNKAWLVKRIAWRIQANAEGDLSERARRRAIELANDADLRLRPPNVQAAPGNGTATRTVAAKFDHDDRLPMPGAVLTRQYKGETISVKVLPDGFDYEGDVYRSLSAVAKAVTGSHWNGYGFFGLKKNGRKT